MQRRGLAQGCDSHPDCRTPGIVRHLSYQEECYSCVSIGPSGDRPLAHGPQKPPKPGASSTHGGLGPFALCPLCVVTRACLQHAWPHPAKAECFPLSLSVLTHLLGLQHQRCLRAIFCSFHLRSALSFCMSLAADSAARATLLVGDAHARAARNAAPS